MSKRLNVWEIGIVLAVAGIGALATAVSGVRLYMTRTAVTLHPSPQQVPSVTRAEALPEWADAVDEARNLARAALSERNLPGLSVAVGAAGRIVWAEGFGWADLDARTPVTPDTRFRIGTASMALTSAAAGVLIDEHRLDPATRIQAYVPAYADTKWPVTLGQLMGHVAGVRTDGGDEGPFGEHCDRPVDSLRIFNGRSLLFEPGTRFRMSSYGWMLVSAAIEAAASQPFLSFMQQRVFAPLNMHDTVADSLTVPIDNRATSYFPRYQAEPRHGLHLMRPLDYSCFAGASVFLSTPSDLVRFGLAIDSGTLLKPDTAARLRTTQRLVSGEDTGYGLGWDVDTVHFNGRATQAVGHDGNSLGGMVASLWSFPEYGIVVAVTSNISYADTAATTRAIGEVFASHAPQAGAGAVEP